MFHDHEANTFILQLDFNFKYLNYLTVSFFSIVGSRIHGSIRKGGNEKVETNYQERPYF